MKVLLATPLLAPDIGGPATYAKILLEEIPKRGIEIDTAYFGEVRDKPKILRHLAYLFLVLRKTRGVDIVYALDPVSVGLPARIAAYLAGKKFMIRIAGDYAWEQGMQRFGVIDTLDDFSKRSGYGFSVSVLKFIQFMVANSARKIVVPSNYFKGVITNWGVREEKIKTIYSVFEFSQTIPDKQACRDELGIHGTILLSAGRLVPWKGFPLLIQLLSELKSKYLEIKLYIAGDGPDRQVLEALVRRFGLEEYVVLLGQLSKETLSKYVRASDVFLLNTSYEGFSHQLLEVMAIGTPIVTTPVGGNVELIKDEVSGLFAPFDDKRVWIEKTTSLIEDQSFSQTITDGAKKRVSTFTVERMVDELVATFNEIK
jgi:glycosyltransferase involved in cell wall biosynthesis